MEWIVGGLGLMVVLGGVWCFREEKYRVGAVLIVVGAIMMGSGFMVIVLRAPEATTASAVPPPSETSTPTIDPTISALDGACEALEKSAVETVGTDWITVVIAVHDVLTRQYWIRDRVLWFSTHEIEGVFTMCGISALQRPGILKIMHTAVDRGNVKLAQLFRDEHAAFCAHGVLLAEAQSAAPWTDVMTYAWQGQCMQLVTSPSFLPLTGAPEIEPIPSSPRIEPCDDLENLARIRDRMASMQLDDAQWIAFGTTLARCDPSREPWTQLHLKGGRDQYERDYVTRFLNGDALTDGRFARVHAKEHAALVKDWAFDGQ
ncbi:hypothetical protein HY480_02965 [Candidatus Uhrbacteria bacterium]|nr:hypothetical protein [Candidatus Uhrbacteria bacterium]